MLDKVHIKLLNKASISSSALLLKVVELGSIVASLGAALKLAVAESSRLGNRDKDCEICMK